MSDDKSVITILLVDDIPETRESIKKLLAFEPDFKVIGSAGNGREGVEQAKELQPDIVIMDINMPDMDGLEAASLITKVVPTVGVIMMSVQNDTDYMRKAMLAGARNFLGKPVNMDELYSTIRNVYQQYAPVREQLLRMQEMGPVTLDKSGDDTEGGRAGNLIVVYSPQGGAGCTTVATNLASALMKEGIKVLLLDADPLFGDVGAFLNLQPPSTLVDLVENVGDIDIDLFDSIVATHDSGLKVVVGPSRPELADPIRIAPGSVAEVIESISSYYDFIVVDTNTSVDDLLISLIERATRTILITNPTLPSAKNVRLVLELFEQLGFDKERLKLIINRAGDERNRKSATLSAERIQNWLKHPIVAQIPNVDERIMLNAINKGVPVIAAERDQNKPPVRQINELADLLFKELMGGKQKSADEDSEASENRKSRIGFLGR